MRYDRSVMLNVSLTLWSDMMIPSPFSLSDLIIVWISSTAIGSTPAAHPIKYKMDLLLVL